jgi:adenylosuccinate synthase
MLMALNLFMFKGNGVVVHIQQLFNEIEEHVKKGLFLTKQNILFTNHTLSYIGRTQHCFLAH